MTDSNTTSGADEQRAALEAMRMAELQALAAELQIVGAGRLRKGELVDAISENTEANAAAAVGVEAADRAEAEEQPPVEGDAVADSPLLEEAGLTPDADGEGAEPASDAPSNEEDAPNGEAAETTEAEQAGGSRRSRRGRNRNRRNGEGGASGQAGEGAQAEQEAQPQQQGGQQRQDDEERGGRGRDRKRGRGGRGPVGDDIDPEIAEDDVLIPVAGILDVLENYAFVRTTGYLPGASDVYVSLGQVKKYGLRRGDAVIGAIRQPREGEQQGRQKYNALVKVDAINGTAPDQPATRVEFHAATAVRQRDALELGDVPAAIRDAGVRIAKGERVLVVGGSASGKTTLVSDLAAAVSTGGETHLMVVQIAGRPEEATELRARVKGEVIISGYEHGPEEHVTVVELAIERAKRLVELGIDVVVLIDSISQLARAYASLAPTRGHADDPAVVLPAKRLFGAARALEDGATLTLVATASADTAIDRLAIAELESIANSTIRL